jgi:hypothetical protein
MPIFLFDEVDTLIHPLKSDLNIPFGEAMPHPYLNEIVSICLETLKNYKEHHIVEHNPSANMQIEHNKKLLYSDLIVFKDDLDIASILQAKITNLLVSIDAKMKYNQAYGFGNYDSTKPITKQKNFFVAIPYGANKKPINGSEFTDFELSAMLTILSYFSSNIRGEDVLLFMMTVQKQLSVFPNLNQNLPFKNTLLKIYCKDLLEFNDIVTLDTVVYEIEHGRNPIDKCNSIADLINKGDRYPFLFSYLKNIIFKYFFDILRDQSNISMVDIYSPSVSYKKVSFSGTVNFNIPGSIIKNELLDSDVKPEYFAGQIDKIESDNAVGGSIEAAVVGITTNRPTMIEWINKSQIELENDLLQVIIDAKGSYSALIDSGGLVLNYTPLEVIEHIKDSLSPDTTILYVDNTGVRQIYNQTDGSSHPYKNEEFQKLFIYYDNKHCVGIDFKQPFDMKGLVTISINNNLSEVSQGIFRLRGINIGNYIDFYYDERIKNMVNTMIKMNDTAMPIPAQPFTANKLTPEGLFYFLSINDIHVKTSVLENAKIQCIKYVYRVDKHYSNKAYEEKIFYDSIKLPANYFSLDVFSKENLSKLPTTFTSPDKYFSEEKKLSSSFAQTFL